MPLKEIIRTLKQKREALGLTIEDVSRQTRINSTVIANIENNDIDKMNAVYLKGFLKMYIEFLGLQKDLTVALDNEFKKKETPVAAAKPESRSVLRAPSTAFSTVRTALAVLVRYRRTIGFLIAAALAAWVVLHGINALSKRVSTPKKKTAASVRMSARSEVSKTAASGFKIKKASDVRVVLRAKKECFIRVRKDGITVFDGIVPKGTVRTWIGQKEIVLSINDSSAVEIEVNGDLLPLGKRKRSIKSLTVGLERITVQ